MGAGSKGLPSPSVSISPNYLDKGFLPGVTEVYLAVTEHRAGLSFPANLVGGMATPNFEVSGIARDLGPVGGDLNDLIAGTFDPTKYFAMASGDVGKLLGAIQVAQIISRRPGRGGHQRPGPTDLGQVRLPGRRRHEAPHRPRGQDRLDPEVSADPLGFFQPQDNSSPTINAEIYTPIADPSQTTYSIHGDLTISSSVLFGADNEFIGITFNSFTFDSKTGAKTSIKPDIDSVAFLGPLNFINDLEDLLSSLGGPRFR